MADGSRRSEVLEESRSMRGLKDLETQYKPNRNPELLSHWQVRCAQRTMEKQVMLHSAEYTVAIDVWVLVSAWESLIKTPSSAATY